MSEGETTTPSYDDVRRKRAEAPPKGGNFLGPKVVKGRSIDVLVTGTSTRPGYNPADPKNGDPTNPEPYWVVNVTRGTPTDGTPFQEGLLLKENQFMSDWLEENGIENPTGKTFALVIEPYKNNLRFAIDRVL